MAATKLRHRCDDCGRTDATFEALARRVKPGKTKDTKGTLAPWDRRYLCDGCAKAAATSADPPRKLTRLDGAPAEPKPEAPKNMALGDDWGQR